MNSKTARHIQRAAAKMDPEDRHPGLVRNLKRLWSRASREQRTTMRTYLKAIAKLRPYADRSELQAYGSRLDLLAVVIG